MKAGTSAWTPVTHSAQPPWRRATRRYGPSMAYGTTSRTNMGIRQPPASRRGAKPTRPASLVASGARRNSGRRGGPRHQGKSAVTPDEVRLDDLPERLVVDVGASFQALGAV